MREPGADGAPEPALVSDPAFPWPPPENASITPRLVETWRSAVLRPAAFFRAMPAGDTGAAVLYFLVIGIVAAAVQLFWESVLPGAGSPLLPEVAPASRLSPFTTFLLSPVYLLASLLLSAGATHLLVLVLVPGQRGFATTVRVFAYAYSPMLLAVVPRLGPLVGFVWMGVIAVIGVREAHRTSTGRAVTAVVVPLAVAVALTVAAALLIAAGAVLLTP